MFVANGPSDLPRIGAPSNAIISNRNAIITNDRIVPTQRLGEGWA